MTRAEHGGWSPSSLQTMLECSEKFRRRYVLREGERLDSAATLIGKALHHVAELAAVAMRDHGQTLAPDFALDNARAHFDGLVRADGEHANPIPWEPGQLAARHADVEQVTRRWLERAEEWWRRWGTPAVVEWSYKGVPWRGHLLQGQIDVATERHVLIDWKSSRRAMGKRSAQRRIQRLMYSAAYQATHGVFPELFVFVQVTRSKPSTKTGRSSYRLNVYEVPQREEELDLLKRMLVDAEHVEATGAYMLNPDSNFCSADWCEFWSMGCPASLLDPEEVNDDGDTR